MVFFIILKRLTALLPLIFFVISYPSSFAQTSNPQNQQKPKMSFLGIFDAGSPEAGIYKLYDPSDQVLCYILMPETVNRKVVNNQVLYEANSLGSISCLKVFLNVEPQKNASGSKQSGNKK